MQKKEVNTENKIKNAARNVFHKKGFAGTRTRDIAEEAGINLALLNYYFRSKEKLFNIIMLETLHGFMASVESTFNEEHTTLKDKITNITAAYIDLLIIEPHIPVFIMSELRSNPQHLAQQINGKKIFIDSVFGKQYKQAVDAGEIAPLHILHFIINFLGLIIFPFIISPMLKIFGEIKDSDFNHFMEERKKMIPVWINSIMQTKFHNVKT